MDSSEAQGDRYEGRRSPGRLRGAEAFGARRPEGVAVDLGCGPGWYTAALGEPVVALDAALAMLRRTREVAPGSLAVQAELGAPPLRAGALAGGWARNTYLHLRAVDVPLAPHVLHRALPPAPPIVATFFQRHH